MVQVSSCPNRVVLPFTKYYQISKLSSKNIDKGTFGILIILIVFPYF